MSYEAKHKVSSTYPSIPCVGGIECFLPDGNKSGGSKKAITKFVHQNLYLPFHMQMIEIKCTTETSGLHQNKRKLSSIYIRIANTGGRTAVE